MYILTTISWKITVVYSKCYYRACTISANIVAVRRHLAWERGGCIARCGHGKVRPRKQDLPVSDGF